MTQQAALIHHPNGPDIWRRYRITGSHHINGAPWMDAVAQHHPVGICRVDGGYLFPDPPYKLAGNRDAYPATCRTCRRETVAYGPAPARKRKRR